VVARPILNLSLTTKSTAIICIVAFVLIYIGKTTLNLSADRLQNSYLVSKQFQLLDHLDSVVIELARAEAGEKDICRLAVKRLRSAMARRSLKSKTISQSCVFCSLIVHSM
jgi:hypothetical protein